MPVLFALLLQVAPAARLDRAVLDGIAGGVFPGAVVVIGTSDTILAARGYGHFTWSDEAPVPQVHNTLFDLASLTKVVATTSAAMVLVDEGRLDLDRPVRSYLHAFAGDGKELVQVRHLLEHRSGLRAFLALHELTSTAAEARARVLAEPLVWAPGTRVEYSDLNGMLLGWVVEAVAQQPLDEFVRSRVFLPLGMDDTRYVPPRSWRERVMPVGRWRGHPVAGEVHDQNAMRLGGVSGHAGLYSTGADLAKFVRMLLREGAIDDGRARLVASETVRSFTARSGGHRALGWEIRDTSSADNSGRFLSVETYGHTGFTGTSIWIDPVRGLYVILLTNRVYAPRTGRSISQLKEVRGLVADAAVAIHAACRATSRCSLLPLELRR